MQNAPESEATDATDALRRDRFRELSADQILAEVDQVKIAARRADVDQIVLAAQWADLHGALDCAPSPALPGAEQSVLVGGVGTPSVAEFAPAELGAVLGVSTYAATALVADALDLRHRLPRLWARVLAHDVPPWMARRIAELTRGVSFEAVGIVDARVAPWADRLTWSRLEPVVRAAIIDADPERAEAIAQAAETTEGVWLSAAVDDGLTDVHIRTDAASAIEFNAAVDQVASGLADLGDTDTRDVRRAKAVGVLAHPQLALNLFERTAATSVQSQRPSASLVVHVAADAWQSGHGVARVEGIGPITVEQAQRWLGHRNVTVKPVLDPAGLAPVDGYEIPDRMREAVHLLTPADGFPFAGSVSRRADVDHTIPFLRPDQGGPPGQTAIGNLAKLTRRHHRIKTFGRWQVKQPYDGILIWRSPHGRLYLVDHTGTRQLPRTG
jgi:Domain of unknown function (DUF222)